MRPPLPRHTTSDSGLDTSSKASVVFSSWVPFLSLSRGSLLETRLLSPTWYVSFPKAYHCFKDVSLNLSSILKTSWVLMLTLIRP
jgi:hypothetical protein